MSETLFLRSYQARMAEHVKANTHCALWADMGAGKTATLLTAVQEMLAACDISKVLVVAPKRVAAHTWPAEIKRWAQFEGLTCRTITAADFLFKREEVVVAHQGESETVKRLVPTIAPGALLTGEVIHTIGVDLLTHLVALLGLRRWPYDLLVLDDCGLRDLSTGKCRALKSLRERFPTRRQVQLSGTPRPKSLHDVWAQVALLDRGERLGRTKRAFETQWFRPGRRLTRDKWEQVPLPGAEQDIFTRVSDLCVSLLPEDVVQLPERTFLYPRLQLDAATRRTYTRMARECVVTLADGQVTAANGAVLVGKLLQLASGAIFDEDGRTLHVHDVKLDYLSEVVEASPGVPLLVGYWFTHERDRIKARFPGAVELGDAPDTEERWNRGEIDMLLLHPQGGAHGLNLQFNDGQGYWFGPIHRLDLWMQWNKRLHRPGRRSPVFIHVPLVEGTIEQAVLDSLQPKAEGQQRLLEAVRLVVDDLVRG